VQGKGVKPGKQRRNNGEWDVVVLRRLESFKYQVERGCREDKISFPCLEKAGYTRNEFSQLRRIRVTERCRDTGCSVEEVVERGFFTTAG